ncbi:MAG: ATP-binding protein [Bacteroidia bacterium]|nr:ATP-binding protein [Bacteroidia bacterium]
MNAIESILAIRDPKLHASLQETFAQVKLLLNEYKNNFATYTDHSINHTEHVFELASTLLTKSEIENLNSDELYILGMSCLLHDIGMCLPADRIEEIASTEDIVKYRGNHPDLTTQDFIRDIHHELSEKFILHEWESLKIPSKKYAEAIGLVAKGHRKVDLGNVDVYKTKFFVRNASRDFVCLPYLASVLRIADELDVTNVRTPKLLTKYYLPNNEQSAREWSKHIATTQINFTEDKVVFEVKCSDHPAHAALEEQFEKVQSNINYCQKIIRTIGNTEDRRFSLKLLKVEANYSFIDFDPKGIKYSFDVPKVVKAFVGEDLYNDRYTSLREALQNSIDSCRYRQVTQGNAYIPTIKVVINKQQITIEDNGAGMDEFIIENFFGRLGSSFYEQEKVKTQYEAIGQFGVGVFSYFLMAEYVDIETKTSTSSVLKFRIDQDPKSYFHFFDKTNRLEQGTSITLYLKSEISVEFEPATACAYIRRIFKHIEFPIQVCIDGENQVMHSIPLAVNADKEIRARLKLQNKKIAPQIEVLNANVSNADFEGECTLFLYKYDENNLDVATNLFDYEAFDGAHPRHVMSEISVSQKGVFVCELPASIVHTTIGNINLKKKKKINIDRNSFTEIEEIAKLILQLELQLLRQVKYKYEAMYDLEKLVDKTQDFLYRNSTAYFSDKIICNELTRDISEFIYVKVYNHGISEILTLSQVVVKFADLILITEVEGPETLSKQLNRPLLSCLGNRYGSFNHIRAALIRLHAYVPTIIIHDNLRYQCLSRIPNNKYLNAKGVFEKIMNSSYHGLESVQSSKIMTSIWLYKDLEINYVDDSFIYNLTHPFLTFCINSYDRFAKDSKTLKIIRASLEYISDLHDPDDKVTQRHIDELNEIIEPLKSLGLNYTFNINDIEN